MQTRTLDAAQPQQVSYCIPLWVRDEQIKLAIGRVHGRIQAYDTLREEPIAVVCYGPSLNDTWEQVKGYKYIISGSGSHKFLLDRGIIPTWHVEVDPRPHKVDLIGTPHAQVQYLIASTCHPKVFDLLEGHQVLLWHVFANEAEALRTLPRGEWAITGGSNVGLRQMTIARFLGFTDLHVFGMDGCEGPSGKHAAVHPNQPTGSMLCPYDGVDYRTTPAMLECARQTFHELNQMKDVRATFFGNGLVQHMAQHYTPAYPSDGMNMAFIKPELISAEYAKLNAQLHKENIAYGVGGGRHAPDILKLANSLNTRSILDYGCGKGYLAKAIPWPIWEYDPAIPGKTEEPRPADLVVCTDVLEHIEPEKLPFVLLDLKRCVQQLGYFVIHTGAAMKTLPDGRNTHLIQQKEKWWRKQLGKFFEIGHIWTQGAELKILVGPKKARVTP